MFFLLAAEEIFQVCIMLFLVSPTDSDVVEVKKQCLEMILLHKHRHFPLKTGYAVGNTKGERCTLVAIVPGFKGCVWFILFL